MAISIVRLGSPRGADEGLRIGTVRRPPRGVKKEELAKRNFSDVWFLNLARGPIVPLEGLIASLKSGQVIAAGLDVLENEKMSKLSEAERERLEWLFAKKNVIFTPHIGGWSHESLARINGRLVEAILEEAGISS